MLKDALKKHGFDYVIWNIKYANKRAIGNYPAYLKKALDANYGKALIEEARVQEIISAKRHVEEKEKVAKNNEEKVREGKNIEIVDEYLKTISDAERMILEREAFDKLPSFLRRDFEKIRQEKSVSFIGLLRFIVLKKLSQVKNG